MDIPYHNARRLEFHLDFSPANGLQALLSFDLALKVVHYHLGQPQLPRHRLVITVASYIKYSLTSAN